VRACRRWWRSVVKAATIRMVNVGFAFGAHMHNAAFTNGG
jgi:hypothetical protein